MAAIPRSPEFGETANVRRRMYVILAIVALAIVVRLYGINTYPLFGDEYNSILGAKDINLNWNSILYAVLTHFLMRLGGTEFWLRFPAVIFGVAAVPILFRVGERIGGWRCAVACGLLAAAAPFNIFHSQEMRFYSLFILASATFLLFTVNYVDRPRSLRGRLLLVLSGLFLVLSHFLGILALCAQSTAAFFANSRVSKRLRAAVLAGFAILIGVPLIPFVQHKLWDFYSAHAGVTDFSVPQFGGFSVVNFGKLAFALFTFAFGYHVYPLRVGFVIFGASVFGFLFCVGLVNLWKKNEWRMLPVTYLLALMAVFFVLNSIGGRVSSVIGPRHVAFAWPIFVLLTAMGLAAFRQKLFTVLLTATMVVSVGSLWLGWQKDWSPGNVPDYRTAARYATQWNDDQTALILAGRLRGPFEYYFPGTLRTGDWYSYLATQDPAPLRRNRRLITVSDEWSLEDRRGVDRALREITEDYTAIDGRVDYPLFEYVFDRNPAIDLSSTSPKASSRQLQLPLNVYGLEFQDLRLPVNVTANGTPMKVIGASALPNLDDEKQISISLSQPYRAQGLVLLSNVTGLSLPAPGTVVAELLIEDKTGLITTLPLRVDMETASWDQSCQEGANCKTVFQWHKRMALLGQSKYPGAWRDFSAQMHAASFDLPQTVNVAKISIRYVASEGHLYIWGLALNEN